MYLFSFDTNQGTGNFEDFWGYFPSRLIAWGYVGGRKTEFQWLSTVGGGVGW